MKSTSSEQIKRSSSLEKSIDNADKYAMIHRITVKCKEEMENKCLLKPLADYIERVAHYTGLPRAIIHQQVSKSIQEDKYFQLNDRIKIFQFIADFYHNKQMPTYKNIFTWYQSINTKITYPQFYYMVRNLGFEHHTTKMGKEILIEDPELSFERYLFVKKINDLRLTYAPIYYIDERFLDSTFTFPKPCLKDVDYSSLECNGYVFFHAISKQGFLNGLFCAPTTQKDFLKWISHILIPQLPGPSVIVLDSNKLHGSVINTITKYDSKKDMLQYLRQRNIPCNDNLHKAELYELINKCSVKHKCYDVDEIFKAHGHQVLRLPSTFHDLSLTHFLWKHYNSEPTLLQNIALPQIKTVMLDWLSNLPQKLWDTFQQELIETENDIFHADSKSYTALQTNFYIS